MWIKYITESFISSVRLATYLVFFNCNLIIRNLRHDQKHRVFLLICALFLVSTDSLFRLPNPNMVPSYTVSPLRSCARRFPTPNTTFWRRIYRRKKVERIILHIISLNVCEWWTERTVTLLSEVSLWTGTGYNTFL